MFHLRNPALSIFSKIFIAIYDLFVFFVYVFRSLAAMLAAPLVHAPALGAGIFIHSSSIKVHTVHGWCSAALLKY